MLHGAAHAVTIIEDDFTGAVLSSDWTVGLSGAASAALADSSLTLNTGDTNSLSRALISSQNPAFNFYTNTLAVSATGLALGGTAISGVGGGSPYFFFGVADDANDNQLYPLSADNGVFFVIKKIQSANQVYQMVAVQRVNDVKTETLLASNMGMLTTLDRINISMDANDWSIALLDGSGETIHEYVHTFSTDSANFSGYHLVVGTYNQGAPAEGGNMEIGALAVNRRLPPSMTPFSGGIDGGRFHFQWQAAVDETYTLQSCTNLAEGAWREDQEAVTGVNGTMDTSAALSNRAAFFRVAQYRRDIPEQVAFEQYAIRTNDSVAVVFPHPAGIESSPDYRLFVSGQEVFCYADRRFNTLTETTDEFNMRTEPQAYAIFDFAGLVDVEVEILNTNLLAQTQQFIVTPQARAVEAQLNGDRLSFTLEHPGYYVVDPDGSGFFPLQLFTAWPEESAPDLDDPNVLYFAPGVHDFEDPIYLEDNQTLYVAGGAVLRPLPNVYKTGWEEGMLDPHYSGISYERMTHAINAGRVSNITIKGRGVISAERGLPALKRFGLLNLQRVDNLYVEGITLTHSSSWSFHLFSCSNSLVTGTRVLAWFTNGDGICLNSCSDMTVRDCFVHTGDDSLEIKTTEASEGSWDVVFENCVVWNDVGTAMGLVHEINTPVHDVVFRNHTVLHHTYNPSGEWDVPHRGTVFVHPAYGGSVSNVSFENITLESHDTFLPAIEIYNGKYDQSEEVLYATNTPYAQMENLTCRNIRVLSYDGESAPSIVVYDHSPEGTFFQNLLFDQVGAGAAGDTLVELPMDVQGTPDISISN